MGVERFLARYERLKTPYYREHAPAHDLRELVACTWVSVVRLRGGPELVPIVPDGCADIMVYDDAPPVVAGPDATTRWAPLREGTVIVGVRLRPGAARAVLGCRAGLIVNSSAPLADLARGAAALHRRLLAADGLRARQALLEGWARDASTKLDRDVIAASARLAADPHLSIGRLARSFDWNPRAIHRRFLDACGYGPKHLQRIMRVQTALRAAQGGAPPRLAAVAHAAGYADQAHMSRDFRAITGFTPARCLSIARPEVGAWIDW